MKRKFLNFLAIICLIIPCLFVFAACNDNKTPAHTHSYVQSWVNNETHHWHECVDDACSEKDSYSEHIYDNQCDNECNTCNYIRVAPHYVGSEYFSDESHHWQGCTFEGCNIKLLYVEHAYDYVCDTECACGYTREVEHDFSETWSNDEFYCWHNCNVIECEVKNTYAEHVYDDNCDEDCNNCGYVREVSHNFGHTWSVDENYHWYECSCGEKDSYSEHDYVYDCCSICEYVRITNGLTYSYSTGTNSYVVMGIGTAVTRNLRVPEKYNDGVHGEHPVGDIAEGAFKDNTNLVNVVIPGSVRVIYTSAFEGCTKLKKVVIGDGVEIISSNSFKNCTQLESVSIPNTVTIISGCAFYNCSSLEEVTIPDSVTTIGDAVFKNCISLKSITLPFIGQTQTEKTNYNFFGFIFGALEYSKNAENVPASLQTVKITKAQEITPYAFYGCSKIKNVIMPNTAALINTYAFYGCKGLTNVQIPASVQSIATYAFYGCTGLTSIVIPNTVLHNIGDSSFEGCTNLTSMSLPLIGVNKNNPFGTIFGATSYTDQTNYIPSRLHTVTITALYYNSSCSYAFYGCKNIKNIIFADSIVSLGEYAFYECTSLQSVTFGKNFEWVRRYAFYYCTNLTEIKNVEKIKRVSNGAFMGCSKLSLSIDLDNFIEIGEFAFSGVTTSVQIGSSSISVLTGALGKCTQVVFKEGVKTITAAQVDLYALLTVVIPKSVVSIEDGAFSNCTEFVNIYYHGTANEWSKVAVQETTLINVDNVYLYSEAEPIEQGNYWHYVGETPTVWIIED